MKPLPSARPHGSRWLLPRRVRGSLGTIMGLGLLLPASLLGSGEARRPFDIPPGDAVATLKQFATQSNAQLLYSPDDVSGIQTRAIQGEFSSFAALKEMLRTTPLRAQQDESTKAISITVNTESRGPPPKTRQRASENSPPPSAPTPDSPSMKKRSVISFFASLLTLGLSGSAQPPSQGAAQTGGVLSSSPVDLTRTGVIEGRVSNRELGTYLSNVRIQVDGTTHEAVTDVNGMYRVSGVAAGDARVSASYIGLSRGAEAVTVQPGRVTVLNFELARTGFKPANAAADVVQMSKFTVIEERERNAQVLALNQQRQAPNIKNVVARDEYPTGSEDNIADFIRFIPGVSIIYSGRAGTDASIRGMPSDTSGITIDGVELSGAYLGNTRAVSLQAVPTNNISTVEITKVPTPDMPAHGLGGAMNISTRSGFERTKPLFKYDIFSAFDPQYGLSLRERMGPHRSMDAPSIRPSFELSYLLPVNKSLSLSLSGANKLNYNTNASDTSATWDQIQGIPTSNTPRNATVQLATVRSGQAGVDWKLNERNIFKTNISYRMRSTDGGNHGLALTYGSGATGTATSVQGAATGVGSLGQTYSWANLVSHTTHALLKYTHLGDTWRVDASGSYSYSSFYFMPDYDTGYFGGASVTLPNVVIRADGMNGAATRSEGLRPINVSVRDRAGNPVSPHDGRLYTVNSAPSSESGNQVDKKQFKLDLKRQLGTAIPVTIQTGGTVVTEVQKLWNWGKTYNFRPTATASDRIAGNYDLINTAYSNSIEPIFGSKVQWVSPAKLFELSKARPDYFVLNEAAAHQTRVNNSKKLEETISAGYFRADTRLFGGRLWMVGGVRYERTEDDGRGPAVNPAAQFVKLANGSLAKDANGRFIPLTTNAVEVAKLVYKERGLRGTSKYDDFFPSFNSTFNLKDDLVLRFGYAKTIGRPNLPFIIPGATYSTITETTTKQTITVVNSRLKPWKANNYDLSLESYMIKDGFGSVGVFQKDITNFFAVRTFPGTPELLDQYGVIASAGDAIEYDIVSRFNGGDARVRGMEFTYRQGLTFFPQWARGLQVFGNYTRSTLGGSTTADFTGFNPQTLSWGVNFTRPRFALKFSSTEGKETKRLAVATNATTPAGSYQWQGAITRYTLSAEYSISRRATLYASLADFNTPGGYVIIQKVYAPGTANNLRTTRVTEWGQSAIIGLKGEF